MLSHVKNYFRNCRLARMSNGEYCLIRDQGLVKGGRGLKHHETLITFSLRGIAAKFRPSPKADATRERDSLSGRGLVSGQVQLGHGLTRSKSHLGHSH
jgi:hypothetical protein